MKQLLFALVIISANSLFAAIDGEAGKTIFKNRCSSCHKVDKKLVGPPLSDISKRRKEEWIISFVKNSSELIQSGDAEAVAVYNQYAQALMPPHTDLTDDDVRSILKYIDEETVRLASVKDAPIQRPLENLGNNTPLTWKKDSWVFLVWGIIIVILIFVLNAMTGLVETRVNLKKED